MHLRFSEVSWRPTAVSNTFWGSQSIDEVFWGSGFEGFCHSISGSEVGWGLGPLQYYFKSTVASMLLIFPCVRLDCVSFASKTCLDYVWSVNVFMLILWAILPAQVSLPSLVEVVSLLHNWIRSPSRPLNEDHVDFVSASVQFGAPDSILGPDLGLILVLALGSIFGHHFGPLQLQTKSRAPERRPKTEPKTRTKIGPKIRPQNGIRGPKFVRRRKQSLHDLHSAVCWAIGFNCATN